MESESNPMHDYTILQRVSSFEYPAVMSAVRRSCYYFDCVWKSHVRVAAPPEVYQRETIQVYDCANLAATGTFMDPKSGAKHDLNTKLEINHFSTTVVGSISYDNSHVFCQGMQANLNGHRMDDLLAVEDLEVSMQRVTIREDFNSGDMVVLENRVSIPAQF